MAKRLSSLFSSKKDKQEDDFSFTTGRPRNTSLVQSPSPTGKLHKQRLTSISQISLDTEQPPPLLPPPTFREGPAGISNRVSSRPASLYSDAASDRSRPQTPVLDIPGRAASPAGSPASAANRLSKKRSWLPGARPEQPRLEDGDSPQDHWIAGLREKIPYDLTPLFEGRQIPELWDPTGNVIIHVFPEEIKRGTGSFRVHGALFADSTPFSHLAVPSIDTSFGDMRLQDDYLGGHYGGQHGHGRHDSIPTIVPPISGSQIQHVFLPLDLDGDYSSPGSMPKGDDAELLLLYRNWVAFMVGQALVASHRQVSLFSIFLGISTLLRRLGFGNLDGSSWGEIPDSSFARYCEELRLADVRTSREKTIEAIVLAEAMRYWPLYNEGFVHAAGRLEDIKSIHSPKYSKISPITGNRLERASLDVEARLKTLHVRLDDFDFPSMFSGLANSQTSTEAKLIRFKAWRLAFIDMRKFVLAQYKRRYGSWPPKAKSKKNDFDQDGLNRLLVNQVYEDFCNLYDMLANSRSMTNRTIDMQPLQSDNVGLNETIEHAIRSIESEFDRSTPPVLPPIPFDIPLIPSLDQRFQGANHLLTTEKGVVKLKANEINELLLGSYNREYIKPSNFVQEFMAYERKLNTGATVDQLVDNRCGQWLFIYAILQSLPMTAIDARGINFSEGCEYFLFSAPRGGKPWMREDTSTSKAWYSVQSAGQTMSLSADMLDHQPEGIYRRSHCWLMANQWLADAGLLPPAAQQQAEQLHPQYQQEEPPMQPLRPASPSRLSPAASPMLRAMTPQDLGNTRSPLSSISKSSSYTNLQVSMEKVAAPVRAPRPASQYNPGITFDSILGGGPADSKAERKKKK